MMDTLQCIRRIARDQAGATAIEYGFLAALVAIVLIVAIGGIGIELTTIFGDVVSGFP